MCDRQVFDSLFASSLVYDVVWWQQSTTCRPLASKLAFLTAICAHGCTLAKSHLVVKTPVRKLAFAYPAPLTGQSTLYMSQRLTAMVIWEVE